MGHHRATIASLIFACLASQHSAWAAEEAFYTQVTRAVFRLQVRQSICTAGRPRSAEILVPVGSGFFVQDYLGQEPILWVVTARHVLAEPGADMVAKVRLSTAGNSQDVWLLLPREKWFVLEPTAPPDVFPTDVAIMPVRSVDGYKSFAFCDADKCPPVEGKPGTRMENSLAGDPTVPAPILLLGFPTEGPDAKALEPFVRAGIVAYKSRDARFQVGGKPMIDLNAYVVDAFGWPGNSGGPVMNEPGLLAPGIHLLGLVTASHAPVHDFSIVTPVSSIRRLLEEGRRAKLAPVDAWRNSYSMEPHDCEGAPK